MAEFFQLSAAERLEALDLAANKWSKEIRACLSDWVGAEIVPRLTQERDAT